MKQQVHLVSLGVSDVAASRRFYCDGLGFELVADLGMVVFVQGGYSLALGLITNADLAADMGMAVPPPGGSMVTLAHNVASQEPSTTSSRRHPRLARSSSNTRSGRSGADIRGISRIPMGTSGRWPPEV